MLDTERGPVQSEESRVDLFEKEDIDAEITQYFKTHYKSEEHECYLQRMGGFTQCEIDELLTAAAELFSSRNKAISTHCIQDICFAKPTLQGIRA